jgi:beta-galactosidase
VGNGNPVCHEPDQGEVRSLFHGLAQGILQTTTTAGAIQLTASSDSLKSATLVLNSIPASPHPVLAPAKRRHLLIDWRMSPITADAPDVNRALIEQDMNSWDRIEPGQPQTAWETRSGYAIYRTTFTPPKLMQATGGEIVFHAIAGSAQIYLNGVKSVTKSEVGVDSARLSLPASSSAVTLSALLHANRAPAGLVGDIELIPH